MRQTPKKNKKYLPARFCGVKICAAPAGLLRSAVKRAPRAVSRQRIELETNGSKFNENFGPIALYKKVGKISNSHSPLPELLPSHIPRQTFGRKCMEWLNSGPGTPKFLSPGPEVCVCL